MPAKSKAQQRAAGADLSRIRAGKKPRNFKSAAVAKEFATGSTKGKPSRAKRKKK